LLDILFAVGSIFLDCGSHQPYSEWRVQKKATVLSMVGGTSTKNHLAKAQNPNSLNLSHRGGEDYYTPTTLVILIEGPMYYSNLGVINPFRVDVVQHIEP